MLNNTSYYNQLTVISCLFKKEKPNTRYISYFLKSLMYLLFLCSSFVHSQCTVQTINADFEFPNIVNSGTYIYQTDHPDQLGWKTTATDGLLEFWKNGGFYNRYAYSGTQFIELNATQSSGLYQDYDTSIATYFNFSFAHMGRDGVDSMVLKAGPPGGPYNVVMTAATDKTTWVLYSGTYKVPDGQLTTRFIFEALSTYSGNLSTGNFLDAVNFTATIELPTILNTTSGSSQNIVETTICTGTTINLFASGKAGFSFEWYDSSNNLLSQRPEFITPILTEDTQYKIKQKNALNCESNFLTLLVRVKPKEKNIIVDKTICFGENYVWDANNTRYSIAGTYIKNNYGCTADQILNLTVTSKPTTFVTNETICSGKVYSWNVTGLDYNTSGTYTKNNDGCTADQVLNLTVTPKPGDVMTTESICSGQTYTWLANGNTYSTSGTYKITNNGCTADQILNLTVTPKPADVVTTESICSGQTYTWLADGNTYSTSGTYKITNNGCTADQILNLTVTPKPADVL